MYRFRNSEKFMLFKEILEILKQKNCFAQKQNQVLTVTVPVLNFSLLLYCIFKLNIFNF